MQALADGLLAAEYEQQDLTALLRQAGELNRELEHYVCAAVHDARVKGTGWETVAVAAAVSPATARSRWNEKTVRRRLERRVAEQQSALRQREAAGAPLPPRADAQEPAPGTERPSGRLAAALSHLHRSSKLTIREVADRTELSSSYVSRILSGERLPAWQIVETLTELFGGDPEELEVLWETAQGMTLPARQPFRDAAARLNAALRGLYLAAASPSAPRIHEASAKALSVATIHDVLDGRIVPDWKTTAAFVHAVGGTPATIRPLWEAAHYAFLIFLDPGTDDAPELPRPRQPDPGAPAGRPDDDGRQR
ncbi:helix-turn-helix transcriptional regulator [Streptomyces hyaluromycini]|uniref:Helix-turn-helix transcriptional regulator n=1 Tax=Streptomyces hyaluromycini TaxID=1377993 RepID=A0ABV1WRM4_9ACTN